MTSPADLRTRGSRSPSGPDPARARLTVILVHGRGGTAAGMIDLSNTIGLDDVA